jgi:phosphoglycerate dehydrogenase-like enzyme
MLADFEIIVGMRERMPFPASLIRRLPKLKLLITTGMRNRSFDVEAAHALGITVCGTSSGSDSAAELAVGMMIALMRDIPGQFDSMRHGGWQTRPGHELAGKTLGLLGLGRLGSTVAAVGNAFDMRVIAWSQNLTDERAAECNARRVEKDDLFRLSDVLSIHIVLSDRTRGIVGARELALMSPAAYLVNTSRGPIVDEAALLAALQGKKIAGAALDVYGTEPLPADHPIRRLDNVLLTPHIGYVTTEKFAKMYQDAADDIIAFLDARPIRVIL